MVLLHLVGGEHHSSLRCHSTPLADFTGPQGIIGAALILSTRSSYGTTAKMDPWVVFRLFLMPFCVSSFAALVKDADYVLVFPPSWKENAVGISLIAAALVVVRVVKFHFGAPNLSRP
jgi:hypothetical protein